MNQEVGVQERLKLEETIIGDSVREGWEAFKARPGIIIGMMALFIVIIAIGQSIITQAFVSDVVTMNVVSQIFGLFTTVFSAGIYLTTLKMVRRESVNFGLITSGFGRTVPLIVAYILLIIACLIGVILLVIPGIIIALGLSQWLFVVMDRQELGGVEALKASWEMMKGYKLKYFGFMLLLLLINILGMLALIVGLVVTVPLSMLAMASFYNRVLIINAAKPEIPATSNVYDSMNG